MEAKMIFLCIVLAVAQNSYCTTIRDQAIDDMGGIPAPSGGGTGGGNPFALSGLWSSSSIGIPGDSTWYSGMTYPGSIPWSSGGITTNPGSIFGGSRSGMTYPGSNTWGSGGGMTYPGSIPWSLGGNGMTYPGSIPWRSGGDMTYPGSIPWSSGGGLTYPGSSTWLSGSGMEIPGGNSLYSRGSAGFPGGRSFTSGGDISFPGGSSWLYGNRITYPNTSTWFSGRRSYYPTTYWRSFGRWWCTCRKGGCRWNEWRVRNTCQIPFFQWFFTTCCRWLPSWKTNNYGSSGIFYN